VQSDEQTLGALEAARREGFKSVSMDLIYGLPFQSVESFERTLERAIAIDPDRLTVFNYAHLPELFKPQRRINEDELPVPQAKLDILQMSIEKLTSAGYVYIGMDHFAKPDDELAVAQRDGTLYRNFQGYSTHAECDLIGIGATSIGMVGDSYAQNLKGLDEYYAAIDADKLAIFRGVDLDKDDKLRRDVITRLICHFELDKASVEAIHGISFNDYFANELNDLDGMQADGLLKLEEGRIEVQPAGKLLIRNICMVFDRYLRQKQNQRFSKVI
jgi:oxygen-independent coproporphyrinogen-3 oxidase